MLQIRNGNLRSCAQPRARPSAEPAGPVNRRLHWRPQRLLSWPAAVLAALEPPNSTMGNPVNTHTHSLPSGINVFSQRAARLWWPWSRRRASGAACAAPPAVDPRCAAPAPARPVAKPRRKTVNSSSRVSSRVRSLRTEGISAVHLGCGVMMWGCSATHVQPCTALPSPGRTTDAAVTGTFTRSIARQSRGPRRNAYAGSNMGCRGRSATPG